MRNGKIRKQLIENNLIDTIIGLPEKLFMNTGISVLIMILKKNRENKNVLFIDSSKNYIANSKQNNMSEEQINKIVDVYKKRKSKDKFSKVVNIEEIRENDYNLNIPRYVDTFEKEPTPDLKKVVEDITSIDEKIKETNKELEIMIKELEGTTPEEKKYYKENIETFIKYLEGNK